MPPGLSACALGFRPHSGWTCVVAATPAAVIHRARLKLVNPGSSRAGQPYHAAAELPDIDAAQEFLDQCASVSRQLASRGIEELLVHLRSQGYGAAACGIVLASGRPVGALASTLASHAAIHTADGEFFRTAIGGAAKRAGLHVTGVPEKQLWARAATDLNESEESLRERIVAIGKKIGAPWTQDEKHATLVAWIAAKAT